MSSFLNYSNPLWDGYCADPFALRHDGVYYVYGTHPTHSPLLQGRQFVLLRSPNLVDWELMGGALEPVAGFENAAHWAPEVAFANGQFWMYYSAADPGTDDSTHRLRVAKSDSPLGPFRDCGTILFPDEGFTIDASPFCDPQSGQWYLFFCKDFFENRVGTGIAVVPLSNDMMTPLEAPRPAIVASYEWHLNARNRQHYGQNWEEWHTVEGAQVVFRDGQYICFYSGSDWQTEHYGVSYAVADHPLGPWRDEHSAHGAQVLVGAPPHLIGPGHNSIVLAPDNQTQICVYHAWDDAHTARRLCIDPIQWTPDGPRVVPTWHDGKLPLG